jgi:hypothetical protein
MESGECGDATLLLPLLSSHGRRSSVVVKLTLRGNRWNCEGFSPTEEVQGAVDGCRQQEGEQGQAGPLLHRGGGGARVLRRGAASAAAWASFAGSCFPVSPRLRW